MHGLVVVMWLIKTKHSLLGRLAPGPARVRASTLPERGVRFTAYLVKRTLEPRGMEGIVAPVRLTEDTPVE